MPDNNFAIEINNLTHYFSKFKAIDNVSFRVKKGEVFGMLGPNGAGKTTTVRLLNGLLKSISGNIKVMGFDPVSYGYDVRRQTGVLTENPSLYERLSARENLFIFGRLYMIAGNELPKRVDEMLEFFGLTQRADDPAGTFSKGMKQRLALARALMHRPPLLFLDEPTAGLDPESARQVTELIERLSHEEGRTVFLCTHNLTEAQRLCDSIGVINKGQLIETGTLEELAKKLWQGLWVDIEFLEMPDREKLAGVRKEKGVINISTEKDRFSVQVEGRQVAPVVVDVLVRQGCRILKVIPREYTLEEIYFRIQDEKNGVRKDE